jgi:hypothetical protein
LSRQKTKLNVKQVESSVIGSGGLAAEQTTNMVTVNWRHLETWSSMMTPDK